MSGCMEVQVKLLYQCFGILKLHLTWFSCGLHLGRDSTPSANHPSSCLLRPPLHEVRRVAFLTQVELRLLINNADCRFKSNLRKVPVKLRVDAPDAVGKRRMRPLMMLPSREVSPFRKTSDWLLQHVRVECAHLRLDLNFFERLSSPPGCV